MNVCFVTSECVPFAKTGGLADVSGALPPALATLGVNIVVVMPFYDVIPGGLELTNLGQASVEIGGQRVAFQLLEHAADTHRTWFIDCHAYFSEGRIYTGSPLDADRFILLQLGALAAMRMMGFLPDVIHANDWHAALLPSMVRGTDSWPGVRTVLSIHNATYQGWFDPAKALLAGLDPNTGRPVQSYPKTGRPVHPAPESGLPTDTESAMSQTPSPAPERDFSFLGTGIRFADSIVAVSPTYAREILTPEFGHGLEEAFLRRRNDLSGILNGIDTETWNPATDPALPARYDASDLSGKADCRQALLNKFGLEPQKGPVFGVVSRLVWQKGLDLLIPVMDHLPAHHDFSIVILGSGDRELEHRFHELATRFPARFGFTSGYDEDLAHLIEAGSDAFLMPSRFEPCGLNQMYSLRYGTLPVVRRTGGLADTVVDVDRDPARGNGFTFDKDTWEALAEAMTRVLTAWQTPAQWRETQLRGMQGDYSWNRSAGQYHRLYQELVDSRANPR